MFHVVSILIATCFGCTLYHFYAFSGTNLLTRCHSASSLFSAVFCFRNPSKEIFSESDEINCTVNKRSGRSRSPEGTWRGPWGSHATRGRDPDGNRAELWRRGPTWPPTPPLRLYIPRVVKTLGGSPIFHEKFRRSRHRHSQIRGVLTFFPAPCRRGNHHRRLLHHHACLRSAA